jgi:Na+-translocating ferredoxin:NAD+ oxidoreductase RNF subunit RnfB
LNYNKEDKKVAAAGKEKIRAIYEAVPKLNCGFCGFGSCGQFARAVAEGRASPFGCRQNPWAGYRISEIIGIKVPVYGYGFQPAFAPKLGSIPSPRALGEEVQGLSRRVDDILARIERLKARRGNARG